ncbi:S1 RNA-binding domain-containing protein [Streptomyces sp. NBC_00454]|uniref:S1 RNA-binding domain-containing protein n=1 Tax=Streptomyces sp. NBC_00454 TaxID=2975747 RepID=UPI00324DC4A7
MNGIANSSHVGGVPEEPELWAYLKSLSSGERLSGTVADVRQFGVFVALDEGPPHPVYPGVGFIAIPDLSWRRFESVAEVVEIGQRITCEFLYFDSWNGEARLSLRALEPDPFQQFADSAREGVQVDGIVTKLVPFGAFVCVAEGVEGLVHLDELALEPVETPEQVVQVGDQVRVIVLRIERDRRRLGLSRRLAPADSGRRGQVQAEGCKGDEVTE